VNNFFAALQFLTCWPWPKCRERFPEELGRSAVFFPVVGLILGGILVALNLLLRPLAGGAIASVLLVAFMALSTRGLHLDGLSDTFDGLGAGGDKEHILDVMDDSHIGVFGTIAIILVLLLKVRAVESLDESRWQGFVIAPVLSRWAMVLLAYHAAAARQGLGALMIAHLETRHVAGATLISVVVVAAAAQSFGLVMLIAVAALAMGMKFYFHRRLDGITGDICGAAEELSETSVLVLCACGLR